jgi:hypothetical protein
MNGTRPGWVVGLVCEDADGGGGDRVVRDEGPDVG